MLCHVLRTKERRNAVAFSSARYRPVEISYVSLGDRFAAVANCYGDEAVAPSLVRFTELLSWSFHCSVLQVLKLDRRQDVRDIGLIKR